MKARIFIFGAGYSGRAIARALGSEAEFVGGTTRSAEKTGGLAAAGIEPFLYTGKGFAPETIVALRETTHLVVSIAPDEAAGDPVLADLRALGERAMPALAWICYLSTVGVYGDHGGAWVSEESECRPVSTRSRRRLGAEGAWTDFGRDTGIPIAILRLSGIYGPGRNAFVNLTEGTAKRIVKPGQVFNRVHVDDIAGAACHLMREGKGGTFNVTDDEPAPPQDVVGYAAGLMGIDPPPEISFERAELSPMARSFYAECKRVSNARLQASCYRFRYPNYRVALETMWRERTWNGKAAVNML